MTHLNHILIKENNSDIDRDKTGRTIVYLPVTCYLLPVACYLLPCSTMSIARHVTPSEIERETGLGKDQLRKWRQRFGFPLMQSTADGKAAYSRQTVDQLLLIKRLIEAGFRPGQLATMPLPELENLKLGLRLSVPAECRDETFQVLVDRVKRSDMEGLHVLLVEQRAKGTLADFVQDTVAPLLIEVGNAWHRNEIEIHHEHLCTSCIERYLQAEILKFQPRNGLPIVLFALPPGEHHSIGLLMAEAVIAERGARTINIGSHIPLDNLTLAAISCKTDVVALSFSFSYPARDVVPTLRHLRRLLPIHIQIWAGGSGLAALRKHPRGVRIFSQMNQAVAALNDVPLYSRASAPP